MNVLSDSDLNTILIELKQHIIYNSLTGKKKLQKKVDLMMESGKVMHPYDIESRLHKIDKKLKSIVLDTMDDVKQILSDDLKSVGMFDKLNGVINVFKE